MFSCTRMFPNCLLQLPTIKRAAIENSTKLTNDGEPTFYILQVHMTRNSAPVYSFGIRHTQYEAPLIVEVED